MIACRALRSAGLSDRARVVGPVVRSAASAGRRTPDLGERRSVPGLLADADSFEPRDAIKGDVARMIFYIAVHYEGDDGSPDLQPNQSTGSTPPGRQPESVHRPPGVGLVGLRLRSAGHPNVAPWTSRIPATAQRRVCSTAIVF